MTGNQINPDPKVKVEGPFKQYGVDIVPRPMSAISCALGRMAIGGARWRWPAFVYDKDGTLLVATTARRLR